MWNSRVRLISCRKNLFCQQVFAGGENNTIGLSVANRGGEVSDAFTLSLSAEGTEIGVTEVGGSLEPGAATEVSFVWRPASASTYELTAW
ncbi:CARDB domain-containing protein [Methanogenium cariaci]|uniref:CARDB domain-containing protein n=1 Tax=Methanogenium cariaci TaxID=2197 RepID=UPI00155D920B|nr:CARDB domain-containing protein [Methanogenium cariaci]